MRGVNKRALDTYIVHFKHEGGEHSEKSDIQTVVGLFVSVLQSVHTCIPGHIKKMHLMIK